MQRQDYTVGRGEDWYFRLHCREADGRTPLDITGGQVKIRVYSADALMFEVDELTGTAVADGPQGLADITVSPDTQAAAPGGMAAGRYRYDSRAILADGTISDQATGEILVLETGFSRFP